MIKEEKKSLEILYDTLGAFMYIKLHNAHRTLRRLTL